jgi:hypothetical protein
MKTGQDEKQLAERLGQQLRDSESRIDELTAARLQAARRQALEQVATIPGRERAGWALGGFATAAVAVLAIVLWQGGALHAPDLPGDDWDLLVEGDLQLIEDLDFYDWLPEEETAG